MLGFWNNCPNLSVSWVMTEWPVKSLKIDFYLSLDG